MHTHLKNKKYNLRAWGKILPFSVIYQLCLLKKILCGWAAYIFFPFAAGESILCLVSFVLNAIDYWVDDEQ